MDSLPPEMDDVTRFTALRDESQRLLDDARSLVAEMRSALDHCKRHRPALEARPAEPSGSTLPPPLKTHRGGRVSKKRSRHIPRRPR